GTATAVPSGISFQSSIEEWWGSPSVAIDSASFSALTTTTLSGVYKSPDSSHVFALAPTGSVRITDPSHWSTVTTIPTSLASAIPATGTTITGPAVVAGASGGGEFLIASSQRVAPSSDTHRAEFIATHGLADTAV